MSIFASFRQHRLIGGALVLALTQFGASLAGLIRDRIMAATFEGQLHVVDTYLAAFRPSDFLFQVLIMSAMGTVLVPMLAGYGAKGDREGTARLLGGAMGIGGIVFGVIAIVGFFILPWIAPLLVRFDGDQLQLYVQFGRLAFLTNFLFVFGNALGQYLITIQRYWIYGLTPILYTVGTILGAVFLTPLYGPFGPILGTVLGGIIYVIVRLGAVGASGLPLRLQWWHPDISEMGWLMLPRMLALGALQLQLLVFDSIASGLDAGSITINAYTRNFQSVVVGVAGIAIAQSAYALLSQAAASGERQRFWIYVRKGVQTLLAITIPGAIALYFLSPVAARLVHLTEVLPIFTMSLGIYALSIPFESLNHLLLRAFYAMKHTFVPALMTVMGGLAAIACAWLLVPQMGLFSLALGYVVGQAVQAAGLGLLLPWRITATFSAPHLED